MCWFNQQTAMNPSNQRRPALISRRSMAGHVPHNGGAMAKAVNMRRTQEFPCCLRRLITDCDLDLYMTFDNGKWASAGPSWSSSAEGPKEKDRPNLWRENGQ